MERKLVRQGDHALTMSLPSDWWKSKGLKAGDVVSLALQGGNLLVSTPLKDEGQSVSFDVTGLHESIIWHTLIARYIEGYDLLEIKHNNQKLIQKIADSLFGMILTKHSAQSSVLKNIISVPDEDFETILRRSAHILVNQAAVLVELAQGKATFKDVRAEEVRMDNNLIYCLRFLHKYHTTGAQYRYFLLCATLESAADIISLIGEHIGSDVKRAEHVYEGIKTYNELIFSGNLSKTHALLKSMHAKVHTKTYVDGLISSLYLNLRNYLGYLVGE